MSKFPNAKSRPLPSTPKVAPKPPPKPAHLTPGYMNFGPKSAPKPPPKPAHLTPGYMNFGPKGPPKAPPKPATGTAAAKFGAMRGGSVPSAPSTRGARPGPKKA